MTLKMEFLMKRINKIIELLENEQPAYYVSTSDLSYECGKEMGSTWADYIRLDLEHGPLSIAGVKNFMRGLVDSGKTKSGHRTPAVIAELPFDLSSKEVAKSNVWIAKQLLACGVHGLLLCHAESDEAVKIIIEGIRYPIHKHKDFNLEVGKRGHGGEKFPADIWGVSPKEYINIADTWPLNPNGEIIIGVKMENKRAAENCEKVAAVPGLCFGEWGLGDMSLSYGYSEKPSFPLPKELAYVREKIWNACTNSGLYFLGIVTPETVKEHIDKGMMLIRAYEMESVKIGREYKMKKK